MDMLDPDLKKSDCLVAPQALAPAPAQAQDAASALASAGQGPESGSALDGIDRALIAALRSGLPLVPHPYAALGASLGLDEAAVLQRMQRLTDTGVIRRFGAIVRHHEAGYTANAMTVFDIPDDRVALLGRSLAREPHVTLCYRRQRALPAWPYNLYCMIHGRDRDRVLAEIAAIIVRHDLRAVPHQVLFSRRRFKQTAGCYGDSGTRGGRRW